MAFPNHLKEKVDIIFKGKEKDSVFLKNLGFVDKKATKVFKPLESLMLLKRFAKAKTNDTSSPIVKQDRTTLHAQVESLRNVMERCFGIDGESVLAEGGGYRLLFKAYCYDKKGEKILLNNLRSYLRELKNETNKTKHFHDEEEIQSLKSLIYAGVEKILETNQSVELKDIICTECYGKIPLAILNSSNMQVLCSDCIQTERLVAEPDEYKSKSVIPFEENDIPRSG